MEALRRSFKQFQELYHSMPPSQRATLVVLPLLILGAFGFLMFGGRSSSYISLSLGNAFTAEELAGAQQTLINRGLTDFRLDGQRILVPRSEVAQYNAALLLEGRIPVSFASEWEKKFESRGPFTSREQLQEMKDIALAKELRRVIRAIPEIEDASVVWARSKQRARWNDNRPKVKATISLRPRGGYEVTSRLAASLRAAVASMVPDLTSANVVVFDQIHMRHFEAEDDNNPLNGKLLGRIQEFENKFRQSIENALSYIPGVLVTVNVDVENVLSYIQRENKMDPKGLVEVYTDSSEKKDIVSQRPPKAEPGQTSNLPQNLRSGTATEKSKNETVTEATTYAVPSYAYTEKRFIGAMPQAVQVSVSIPEDHYRKVALIRGLTEGADDVEKQAFLAEVVKIKTQVETDVAATVAKNIPASTKPAAERITVSSFVLVEKPPLEIETSVIDTAGDMLTQWGSAVGLALFAAWALWMLNKSMTPLPIEEGETASPLTLADHHEEDEEEEKPEPESTKRDELQSVVRDNPEMAAAVLSKWIGTGN